MQMDFYWSCTLLTVKWDISSEANRPLEIHQSIRLIMFMKHNKDINDFYAPDNVPFKIIEQLIVLIII